MALKAELMAVGLPTSDASRLGYDTVASFNAAGSNQAGATTLTSNNANVTTAASGQGVIVASADQKYMIFNAGPFVLSIYPVVGGTFTGLALNAPVTLAANNSAFIEGGGLAGGAWTTS